MKRKTIIAGIAVVALVITLQTSSVFAAAPTKEKSSNDTNTDTVCNYCGEGCSFIDENGDGICDNYASRRQNGTCGWGGGHGHGYYGHGYGGCHRR